MIEAPARIVRVEGARAWVVPESPQSCGACGGKGCGSSIFSRMLKGGAEPEYPVQNLIQAKPGEAVVVGVADGTLLRAAMSAYVLPLLMVMAGALIGTLWGELQSVAGALAGLALSILWLRRRRPPPDPVVIRLGTRACRTRSGDAHQH